MKTIRTTHEFAYSHEIIVGGAVVGEAEIDGRATFAFTPGSPGRKAHPMDRFAEPDDPPEIEIEDIELRGEDQKTKDPVMISLAPSDPMWDAIRDWLLDERTVDMMEDVDAASGPDPDDLADAARDRELMGRP